MPKDFYLWTDLEPLDGSQNETAIFLKTLNVNTMMSNTEHGGKDYFGKDNLRRCDGTWESF